MLVALWLGACSGSDTRLSVTRDSLSFANGYAGVPPAQYFDGYIHDLSSPVYVAVFYTENGLEKVAVDLSSNPFHIEVTPKKPVELGMGTVEDEITVVVCEDETCEKQLPGSPARVPVRYTVTARIQSSSKSLDLTYVLGGGDGSGYVSEASAFLYGTFEGIGWKATVDQPWVRAFTPSGTSLLHGPVRVGFDREQVSQLGVGSYSANVTVSNPDGRAEALVVPVSLQVRPPAFSVTPNALTFGPEGAQLLSRTLSLTLGTGSAAYAWTATVDTGSGPAWLSLSRTEGQASTTPTELKVRVDPTGLPDGTHTAGLTFTTTVKGVTFTQTVPVSMTLEARKLYVSDNGVGLVHTPSASRLTQTVTVKANSGQRATPWTASSNQPWLSVTSSGDETLTVTAAPEGLAADILHLATVTLRPEDSAVEGDTLQVGLWVGASASNSRDTLTASYRGLAMDPIRPYAYVHDWSNLVVYNIYTAAEVARLPALGADLSTMAISTDGAALYVVDARTRLIPVNLSTLTAGTPWSSGRSSLYLHTYARPGGRGVLLFDDGLAYDPAQGRILPVTTDADGLLDSMFSVRTSVDGSVLCGSGNGLACGDLRSSSSNGGSVDFALRARAGGGAVAIKEDGSRVYTASYERCFEAYDTRDLNKLSTRGKDFSGVLVTVGVDGRLYGVANTWSSSEQTTVQDVKVFEDDGTSLGSYRVASKQEAITALGVSGDGKRFVAVSSQKTLDFISSP
ncbi:fibronectin type III domain protein [Archangium gephyra]|uniref:Fibronectin type III domain protein n=1 Tax=Archangium gephyra TaxID=48 RepID=A0AAC8QEX3_9BACT|nr:fibronectin type III domain protein [Archangium gephyra]